MSLDRDNLFNIISQMEYPEIRKTCLASKNYNKICSENAQLKSILERKLSQYVEKILAGMQEYDGFVDWNRPSVRHSDEPDLEDYDNDEQPFVYKYIKLNSLIQNHTLELYDDYDPVWGNFNYGQMNENNSLRFKLSETISLPTSGIDYALRPFLVYAPEIPKRVIGTANVGVDKIRTVLVTLVRNGTIG